MTNLISSWVLSIPQSGIRVVYHEALKYSDVIHLEIGDPDINTPTPIIKEACRALNEGYTHYTHNAGLIELREAIAEYYKRLYNVKLDPQTNIMVTLGSTEALFLSLLTVLNPGDEVLIPDPGYPSYIPMIKAARGIVKRYRLHEDKEFMITSDEVLSNITPRTKVIIVNNPHNPTGSITPLVNLVEIVKEAYRRGIVVISDEVYERIVYDNINFESLSKLTSYDNIIVVNSLSKTYAMTGWRIGFAITFNEEIIKVMTKLQEGVAACAPSAFQKAATYALLRINDHISSMVKNYQRKRDEVIRLLSGVNDIKFVKPRGTFYIFVNVSNYIKDSMGFALNLLKNEHVAVAPGIAFGPNSEGYIRISYATSLDKIIEGVKKLINYLKRIRES